MKQPSRDELPDLVRDLHRTGTPWLPAGLASRLDWGPPPRQPCEPLSVARLSRIVEHNPGDFTITVEAGLPLAEAQRALATHGQWLAVDPPWGWHPQGDPAGPRGGGSIGGLVARGLAGGFRQRHLGLRDQLIGVALLRADGTAARAGGRVVKNVAGYDLMRLLAGSWGSLALITEVSLRTMPLPPHRVGLLLRGELEALSELRRALLRSTLAPERIDWWSAALAGGAGLGAAPALLITLASVEARCLQDQLDAVAALGPLTSQRLSATEVEGLLQEGRGGDLHSPAPAWLLRLGVNPASTPRLLEAGTADALKLELGAGSGLGMAWSEEPIPASRVEALRTLCQELGGFLTVLRQPPDANLIPWRDASAKTLIEAVKRAFDPKGQLAPGRLPGVAVPAQSVVTR
ncbi:MAG: FAD-binding oxidoreductase [Cyanobacteria bacterium K_Offshore_surface_m2_239]|nr:FAD-binding oxidoreductase [Cyanobacteria bacterium K_Offshore_surface_m2_239]